MVEQIDVSDDQNGGILKEIKRAGPNPNDKPWKGDKVLVHYTGTLDEDGSKFDSSRDRNEKFSFNLGKGEVIKGWDQGVASMVKGELAVLTIKSDYGYGDVGSPPKIPGGATLKFEIELFDFEGEDISKDKDKSVVKRIKSSGEGYDHPNDGGTVTVGLCGQVSNKVFFNEEITFVLGEGRESGIPKGVELALEKMKKNEQAQISIIPKLAQGGTGVPQVIDSSIVYDINLKTFERAKESWQLDGEQKLEQASIFKDKGTDFFKQGKYELAANKYKKIIDFLEHEISLKDDKEEQRVSLLQAGRLNLAMCMIKISDWLEARNLCDKVIEENPNHAKAYFRRGESLIALNEHELAKIDFHKVLDLDPENKAAKNKVTMCMHQLKLVKEKERKTFANMFDKFARIDAKKEEEARKQQMPLEIDEWGEGRNNGNAAADEIALDNQQIKTDNMEVVEDKQTA